MTFKSKLAVLAVMFAAVLTMVGYATAECPGEYCRESYKSDNQNPLPCTTPTHICYHQTIETWTNVSCEEGENETKCVEFQGLVSKKTTRNCLGGVCEVVHVITNYGGRCRTEACATDQDANNDGG